jgi:hypothetical protein
MFLFESIVRLLGPASPVLSGQVPFNLLIQHAKGVIDPVHAAFWPAIVANGATLTLLML